MQAPYIAASYVRAMGVTYRSRRAWCFHYTCVYSGCKLQVWRVEGFRFGGLRAFRFRVGFGLRGCLGRLS